MMIRRLKLADLPRVSAIEEACFTRPWTEATLYRDFTQNPSSMFYVVEVDGRVVGHLGVWRREKNLHVTTLAVDKDYRRHGLATKLLENLRTDYPQREITLEVRVSNRDARSFYMSMGFVHTGVRPNYYSDNDEHALVMCYSPGADSGAGKTEEAPRHERPR